MFCPFTPNSIISEAIIGECHHGSKSPILIPLRMIYYVCLKRWVFTLKTNPELILQYAQCFAIAFVICTYENVYVLIPQVSHSGLISCRPIMW